MKTKNIILEKSDRTHTFYSGSKLRKPRYTCKCKLVLSSQQALATSLLRERYTPDIPPDVTPKNRGLSAPKMVVFQLQKLLFFSSKWQFLIQKWPFFSSRKCDKCFCNENKWFCRDNKCFCRDNKCFCKEINGFVREINAFARKNKCFCQEK